MKDLHNIWGHRWITPKAEPRQSTIEGTGMFATKPIKQDEVVAMYGGIIVPKSDIEKYRQITGAIRGIQVEDDFYICPTEPAGGLFNHSCSPTLGYGNQITIVAIRDVDTDKANGVNISPHYCKANSSADTKYQTLTQTPTENNKKTTARKTQPLPNSFP